MRKQERTRLQQTVDPAMRADIVGLIAPSEAELAAAVSG
jgi:hypothetical protein